MTTTIRVIALLIGGVALGMTLLIAVLYHQARHIYARDSAVSANHVLYMGIAHMCLIIGLMSAILVRVRDGSVFSWWITPAALVGFSLTVLALVQLLRSHQLRQLHSDVEAHIHSS